MSSYTAILKQDGEYWIGWVEEVLGRECPGEDERGIADFAEGRFCAKRWNLTVKRRARQRRLVTSKSRSWYEEARLRAPLI